MSFGPSSLTGPTGTPRRSGTPTSYALPSAPATPRRTPSASAAPTTSGTGPRRVHYLHTNSAYNAGVLARSTDSVDMKSKAMVTGTGCDRTVETIPKRSSSTATNYIIPSRSTVTNVSAQQHRPPSSTSASDAAPSRPKLSSASPGGTLGSNGPASALPTSFIRAASNNGGGFRNHHNNNGGGGATRAPSACSRLSTPPPPSRRPSVTHPTTNSPLNKSETVRPSSSMKTTKKKKAASASPSRGDNNDPPSAVPSLGADGEPLEEVYEGDVAGDEESNDADDNALGGTARFQEGTIEYDEHTRGDDGRATRTPSRLTMISCIEEDCHDDDYDNDERIHDAGTEKLQNPRKVKKKRSPSANIGSEPQQRRTSRSSSIAASPNRTKKRSSSAATSTTGKFKRSNSTAVGSSRPSASRGNDGDDEEAIAEDSPATVNPHGPIIEVNEEYAHLAIFLHRFKCDYCNKQMSIKVDLTSHGRHDDEPCPPVNTTSDEIVDSSEAVSQQHSRKSHVTFRELQLLQRKAAEAALEVHQRSGECPLCPLRCDLPDSEALFEYNLRKQAEARRHELIGGPSDPINNDTPNASSPVNYINPHSTNPAILSCGVICKGPSMMRGHQRTQCMNRLVPCPNKLNGCKANVSVGSLSRHLKRCLEDVVLCESCDRFYQHKKMVTNQNERKKWANRRVIVQDNHDDNDDEPKECSGDYVTGDNERESNGVEVEEDEEIYGPKSRQRGWFPRHEIELHRSVCPHSMVPCPIVGCRLCSYTTSNIVGMTGAGTSGGSNTAGRRSPVRSVSPTQGHTAKREQPLTIEDFVEQSDTIILAPSHNVGKPSTSPSLTLMLSRITHGDRDDERDTLLRNKQKALLRKASIPFNGCSGGNVTLSGEDWSKPDTKDEIDATQSPFSPIHLPPLSLERTQTIVEAAIAVDGFTPNASPVEGNNPTNSPSACGSAPAPPAVSPIVIPSGVVTNTSFNGLDKLIKMSGAPVSPSDLKQPAQSPPTVRPGASIQLLAKPLPRRDVNEHAQNVVQGLAKGVKESVEVVFQVALSGSVGEDKAMSIGQIIRSCVVPSGEIVSSPNDDKIGLSAILVADAVFHSFTSGQMANFMIKRKRESFRHGSRSTSPSASLRSRRANGAHHAPCEDESLVPFPAQSTSYSCWCPIDFAAADSLLSHSETGTNPSIALGSNARQSLTMLSTFTHQHCVELVLIAIAKERCSRNEEAIRIGKEAIVRELRLQRAFEIHQQQISDLQTSQAVECERIQFEQEHCWSKIIIHMLLNEKQILRSIIEDQSPHNEINDDKNSDTLGATDRIPTDPFFDSPFNRSLRNQHNRNSPGKNIEEADWEEIEEEEEEEEQHENNECDEDNHDTLDQLYADMISVRDWIQTVNDSSEGHDGVENIHRPHVVIDNNFDEVPDANVASGPEEENSNIQIDEPDVTCIPPSSDETQMATEDPLEVGAPKIWGRDGEASPEGQLISAQRRNTVPSFPLHLQLTPLAQREANARIRETARFHYHNLQRRFKFLVSEHCFGDDDGHATGTDEECLQDEEVEESASPDDEEEEEEVDWDFDEMTTHKKSGESFNNRDTSTPPTRNPSPSAFVRDDLPSSSPLRENEETSIEIVASTTPQRDKSTSTSPSKRNKLIDSDLSGCDEDGDDIHASGVQHPLAHISSIHPRQLQDAFDASESRRHGGSHSPSIDQKDCGPDPIADGIPSNAPLLEFDIIEGEVASVVTDGERTSNSRDSRINYRLHVEALLSDITALWHEEVKGPLYTMAWRPETIVQYAPYSLKEDGNAQFNSTEVVDQTVIAGDNPLQSSSGGSSHDNASSIDSDSHSSNGERAPPHPIVSENESNAPAESSGDDVPPSDFVAEGQTHSPVVSFSPLAPPTEPQHNDAHSDDQFVFSNNSTRIDHGSSSVDESTIENTTFSATAISMLDEVRHQAENEISDE